MKSLIYKLFLFALFFAASFYCLLPGQGLAQSESLTISITPPLIRNNVSPGQVWKSSVKLVNNNAETLTAYVRVQDFRGKEDNGSVEFIKPSENAEANTALLSSWIELPEEKIEIEPFGSKDIPFTIRVPREAGAGGHYAAILAGSNPPELKEEGSQIRVSSLLASLLLINVQGEVSEIGRIREFSTAHSVNGSPNVDFALRFENIGNTHLQPQGEIQISNMFKKEKGTVPINHGSDTGYVLPGDIRRWDFAWKAPDGFWDMGKYRADLILTYGESSRQTVYQTMFFWVIFWKPLLLVVSLLILLIGSIYAFVKYSVRKAIRQSQQAAGYVVPAPKAGKKIVVPKKAKDKIE